MWGTGEPLQEFLHVDDLASACLFLMNTYSGEEPVNIGTGEDITINELARIITGVTGYQGAIEHDQSKPDGTPRKLLDVSLLHGLGWKHGIGLEEGIRGAFKWYSENR